MVSSGHDGKLVITNLNNLQVIHTFSLEYSTANIPELYSMHFHKLRNLLLHPHLNSILVNVNESFRAFNVPVDFFSQPEAKRHSSLKYVIMRHCLKSKMVEESKACTQFLKNELFLDKMLNIANILAWQGKSAPLKAALEIGVPFLTDCQGKSPLEYCVKHNDSEGITAVLKLFCRPDLPLEKRVFDYALASNLPDARNLLNAFLFRDSSRASGSTRPILGRLKNTDAQLVTLRSHRNIDE